MRQFDAEDQNITLRNGRIESICILNRENGEKELYQGDIFVDATYEGDLGAAAASGKFGVSIISFVLPAPSPLITKWPANI